MRFIILALLITIPSISHSKSYKVSELKSMIKKKKYPKQGQPQSQSKAKQLIFLVVFKSSIQR